MEHQQPTATINRNSTQHSIPIAATLYLGGLRVEAFTAASDTTEYTPLPPTNVRSRQDLDAMTLRTVIGRAALGFAAFAAAFMFTLRFFLVSASAIADRSHLLGRYG